MTVDLTVYAIPVFVFTMVVEAVWLARRRRAYEPRDTAASLSGGLGMLAIDVAWKAVKLGAYAALYEHRIADPGTGVLAWVLLVFAEDLVYYVYHRVGHEVRLFWAGHVAHHSSQRYTLATALRQSWTSPLFGLPFWAPLALLGFRPEMILTAKSISLLYQYWIHTEAIDKLGPLEWVMNTPSHHRVHHGSNPEYLDKNYAGIFIIWDRLFGTFEPERAPVAYGLTKNIDTYNPFRIQLGELAQIGRELLAAKSWGERRHAVFGRTGTAYVPAAERAARA
jgi:sterol desaturase/sphingolipid hydroxylase (fatty acid hydroxylase superfamily)